MRFRELIEAPLQDFRALGSLDEPGSFRDDDLRAFRNPKWLKKLHTTFSNTPFNINLYVLNAPDNKHRYEIHYKHGITHQHGFELGLDYLHQYGGSYKPERFEEVFGFLPPDYKNSISVLFTMNEGSQRLPFTQWMIAHRLIHAVGDTRRAGLKIQDRMGEIFERLNNLLYRVETCMEQMDFLVGKLPLNDDPTSRTIAVMKLIGKTRAFRTGSLTSGGECVPELGAQYLTQGQISFRRIEIPYPVSIMYAGIRLEVDQQWMDNMLNEQAAYLTDSFRKLFEEVTGMLFVL